MADEQQQGTEDISPLEYLRANPPASARQEQQETAAPVEGQEQESPGFAGQIADMGRGIVDGIQTGAEETLETIQWAGEGIGNAVTGGSDVYYTRDDGFAWLTEEEVRGRDDIPEWQTRDLLGDGGTVDLPEVEDPTTMAGGITKGITQFLVGYGAAGKMLKGARMSSAARAATAGAASDFVAFDEHEERFSDFLRDNAGLRDPITGFLSADEDDSVAMGKLKNTLEGMGLGLATEGITRLAGAFKKAKRVQQEQGEEAAAEVMNDEVAKIEEDEQLSLFSDDTDLGTKPEAKPDPDEQVQGQMEEPERPSVANAREQAPSKDRPDFDQQGFTDAINRDIALYRGGANRVDPGEQSLDESFFNFDKMDSDLTTQDYMRMATDAVPMSGIQDTKTFERMSSEAEQFLADSIDGSRENISSYLRRTAEDAKRQQAAVIGGKKLLQSMSREVEQLAFKVNAGKATDEDYAKLGRMQGHVLELTADLKSVQKSAAQTTAAGRIRTRDTVTGNEVSTLDMREQLREGLDRKSLDKLAADIEASKRAGNDPTQTTRTIVKRAQRGFWNTVNEVRINGLLSGPRTHAINTLSNGLQTMLLPAEKTLGGAVFRDGAMMREGLAQYQGIALAMKDSFKAAAMAGWKGDNILDPVMNKVDEDNFSGKAISSNSDNAAVRHTVNTLGKFIRFPSRMLLTGDEFFKQINYRSELYGRLNSQVNSLVQQGKVKPDEAAAWVERKFSEGFDDSGQWMNRDSIQHAREATFTNELRDGSLGKGVQNLTNRHPYLKLILPFVRTPTNIIRAGFQRTPGLGFVSKQLRDDLSSGDPRRKASATGKIASGSLLWGYAATLAAQGNVTGGGPVDPVAKQRLMETGWKPYSFVRTQADGSKEYVEFNRMDPFAMMFGIAADLSDIVGEADEKSLEDIGIAGVTAAVNNIGAKTWLQGITDLADAVANPDMSMEYYLRSQSTTFLPYSSAMREARKADDPAMREVRDLTDQLMNTIPGYSSSLPAKRSWITGEPIIYPKGWGSNLVTPLGDALASMNPIMASEGKDDLVLNEIARLGHGFSGPSKKVRGIELTSAQYSEFMELHGKIRAPGTKRTMYQELRKQMQTETYDINRERAGDFSDPELDPRVRIVSKVIRSYRQLAQEELLRRHPDLASEVVGRKQEAQRNARQMYSGVRSVGQ